MGVCFLSITAPAPTQQEDAHKATNRNTRSLAHKQTQTQMYTVLCDVQRNTRVNPMIYPGDLHSYRLIASLSVTLILLMRCCKYDIQAALPVARNIRQLVGVLLKLTI